MTRLRKLVRGALSAVKETLRSRTANFRSSSRVIVSLTTISRRVERIELTLRSIRQQTYAPDEIHIFLSESPYLYDEGITAKQIPSFMKKLEAQGHLQIRYTRNIGSYRKLIPLLKERFDEDCLIVTADDDIIYPRTWLEGLVRSFHDDPSKVTAYRTRKMLKQGEAFIPYSQWPLLDPTELHDAVDPEMIFPTGKCGVLYSPRFFSELVFDEAFIELAPFNDDIWIKFMTLINKVGSKVVHSQFISDKDFKDHFPSGRHFRLFTNNLDPSSPCNNDIAVSKVVNYLQKRGDLH